MSCPTHQTPSFGCSTCIESDRRSWARNAYEAWKKTYKPPKCPDCGRKMYAFEWEMRLGGLVASVACTSMDSKSGSSCDIIELVIA